MGDGPIAKDGPGRDLRAGRERRRKNWTVWCQRRGEEEGRRSVGRNSERLDLDASFLLRPSRFADSFTLSARKWCARGLVIFITAVARLFCLAMPGVVLSYVCTPFPGS